MRMSAAIGGSERMHSAVQLGRETGCAVLRWATPMEMIDVGGLRIGYERAGEGPPLVLLHGYVGDGPTTWRRQLEGLADEFTVIAWDAPGAGRSSDPPEMLGMAGYADCLAGFVAALGLERPHVAGLSFVVLPDTGHLCNLEAPHEFNTAVRSFLHERRS